MQPSFHPLTELFAQLGLPSDAGAIEAFLASHGPLPAGMALADAPFWTPAQAALLRDEVEGDADWAEVVDCLDVALRQAH